jgi:hypothetical protein
MSLSDFNSQLVNRETPKIEKQVIALRKHVEFLARITDGKQIDGRDALRAANGATKRAIAMRHSLSRVATMASTVRRRDLGSRYGTFQGNYRGMMRRIGNEFDRLESAILKLNSAARGSVNDPGRWGDAAAGNAVNTLLGLLQVLLDIWRLERTRQKLDS